MVLGVGGESLARLFGGASGVRDGDAGGIG